MAHPSLQDPNFRRTVLFLANYDPQEGSLGLILNRPTDRQVGDLLSGAALGELSEVPVYVGGPVATDQLTFAAFEPDGESFACKSHLAMDDVWSFAADEEVMIRAFVGYAGWSGGQLEAELAQKAWIVQKPTREWMDLMGSPELWTTIMHSLGPWFRLLAAAPEDPSRN